MNAPKHNVLAISGGVGGAKLALGLTCELTREMGSERGHEVARQLHVLVNTADDFEHLGLHISPDIDTLLYTLAALADPKQGWGIANESFTALDSLEQLGGETWFRLGDKDLATHLFRCGQLAAGKTLSEITSDLAQRLGIAAHVHPMTDDPVRTQVATPQGTLAFQHYFVRERCEPVVSGIRFEGIEQAAPNASVMDLLRRDTVSAVVICPSNPFVSIDPILQVPGVWEALRDADAPVILVSPIVAGIAIKGPAAKMMAEMNMPVTALGVAGHYHDRYPGLVDHFVIDESDGKLAQDIGLLGMGVEVTPTIMRSLEDKRRLARGVLDIARQETS